MLRVFVPLLKSVSIDLGVEVWVVDVDFTRVDAYYRAYVCIRVEVVNGGFLYYG